MTRRKDKMVIVVDTREPKPGEEPEQTELLTDGQD